MTKRGMCNYISILSKAVAGLAKTEWLKATRAGLIDASEEGTPRIERIALPFKGYCRFNSILAVIMKDARNILPRIVHFPNSSPYGEPYLPRGR